MSAPKEAERSCELFRADLATLATNLLTGRRRGAVMAHVGGCQACSAELAELTSAADLLLVLAPEVDAPLGFESRLAERLQLPVARRSHSPRRRPMFVALGFSLLLVAALLTGITLGEHHISPPPTLSRSASLTSATINGAPNVIGKVTLLSGTPTWLVMTLNYAAWVGRVDCQVTLQGGRTKTLGTFRVGSEYDSWALPIRAPITQVVQARLLDAAGAVLATASLSR